MTFKRIIASLLLDQKKLVKGKQFKDHKIVGFPKTYCKSLGSQKIDEILVCDLNSYKNPINEPDYSTLSDISSSTMTPLTFGGGINSLQRIKKSFYNGADKVYLSSVLYKDISIIEKSAKIYGSQSIVGGINVVEKNNELFVLEDVSLDFYSWIKKIESAGAGEIKINFVDKEGTSEGFNLDHCKKILEKTSLPVIFEGGMGSLNQIKLSFEAGVDNIALGRMISFEDNNIFKIKQFLKNNEFYVR